MRSTFHGLEVAKRGLFAQNTAINTTGHNIGNINTPGYSRQRVNLTADRPIEVPAFNRTVLAGQLGTGVNVDSIKRIRETFLDEQFWNESPTLGYWDVQKNTLEKIETLFKEPTDEGLRAVIDEFWNAWQDMTVEPQAARTMLKERAISMIDAFKHLDKKLTELGEDLTTNIDRKVTEANGFLAQIAELNKEIRRTEALGYNANDLRDKRDLLTDELARIASISVQEETDGMYTIFLRNEDGTLADDPLVSGQAYTALTTDLDFTSLAGGELKGLDYSRRVLVGEYKSHVEAIFKGLLYGEVEVTIPKGSNLPEDALIIDPATGNEIRVGDASVNTDLLNNDVKVIVKGINGLHGLGWSMYTNPDGTSMPGLPFFLPANEDDFDIQQVMLNPEIAADVRKIASSFRTDAAGKTIVSNVDLALAIAQLRDATFTFTPALAPTEEGTFDQYFRSVIGGLGSKTQEAQRSYSHYKLVLSSVENQRLSVSGVSLDEEMANLVQFQHAYNASARILTTVDEMLDKVINGMGIVGR